MCTYVCTYAGMYLCMYVRLFYMHTHAVLDFSFDPIPVCKASIDTHSHRTTLPDFTAVAACSRGTVAWRHGWMSGAMRKVLILASSSVLKSKSVEPTAAP